MDNAPNSLEPVAFMYAAEGKLPLITGFRVNPADYGCAGRPETPLYAHPAPKPADSQLVDVVMRELDVQEMVMTDPQTLKRLQAERILRAISQHQSPKPADSRLVEKPGVAQVRKLVSDLENFPEDLMEIVRLSEPAQRLKAIISQWEARHQSPADAERDRIVAENKRLREELALWDMLVEDEGGCPRYNVSRGAALNSVVTSTKAILASGAHREAVNG